MMFSAFENHRFYILFRGRVIRACPALQPGADGLHLTLDALADLAPGMYLLDIRTDGQSHIHKLEKR